MHSALCTLYTPDGYSMSRKMSSVLYVQYRPADLAHEVPWPLGVPWRQQTLPYPEGGDETSRDWPGRSKPPLGLYTRQHASGLLTKGPRICRFVSPRQALGHGVSPAAWSWHVRITTSSLGNNVALQVSTQGGLPRCTAAMVPCYHVAMLLALLPCGCNYFE